MTIFATIDIIIVILIIITTNITGDERETSYLFQQMSIALQRGNAVSFQNTFTAS